MTQSVNPIQVRPADSSDAPELARLLGQLGYTRAPEALVRFIDDEPSTRVLVATLAGESAAGLAGLLALSLHAQIHLAAPTASLDAFVVDEGCRSSGIGRVLLDRAYSVARDAGATRIELHSNLRRAGAHRFYEREGFTMTSKFFVRGLD